MIYANYSDYIYRYLGRAIRSEEDFDRLALRASAFLDRITFGRAEHYRDTKGKLALACCAVAERLQAQGKLSSITGSSSSKQITRSQDCRKFIASGSGKGYGVPIFKTGMSFMFRSDKASMR